MAHLDCRFATQSKALRPLGNMLVHHLLRNLALDHLNILRTTQYQIIGCIFIRKKGN